MISNLVLALAFCSVLNAVLTLVAEPEALAISQVRLSWTEDPRTTMTVTWQEKAEDSSSHVRFGSSPQNLNYRAPGANSRYPYETGVVRSATLKGLEPSRWYYYQVVGGAGVDRSEMKSFLTAPSRDEPFTFTAYGDQGITPEAKDIVQRVLAEKPAFHLHLGDLSYANLVTQQRVWDNWLELIEPLSSRIPYMPTLGNHENERMAADSVERIGYTSYLARFALPPPETRYAFDYGRTRFVAFNSDDFANPAQMHWFRQELRAARADSNVRWLIVFQHHPPYSSTLRRLNHTRLIESLEKTLDEFKVDLVLAGHHHNYERTLPMRAGQVTHVDAKRTPQSKGTIYVVSGGAGKSLYEFVPERPAWCAAREKTFHYLRIQVVSKKLTITAVRKDGSVIEQFEIDAADRR